MKIPYITELIAFCFILLFVGNTNSQSVTVTEWKTLFGHTDAVSNVSFSPNGKLLATGSKDNTIKLWSVNEGREIRTISGHSGGVYQVSFTPDGKFLTSGSWDKSIRIWSVETGRELNTLIGPTSAVLPFSFNADGSLLASGSYDKITKLWSVETGRMVRTISGDWHAFSPNGQVLATFNGGNKAINLWSPSTGKKLRTLSGHSGAVTWVSFSPVGRLLASGSFDKTIRIWSVSTGEEVEKLIGHSEIVNRVIFNPSGKILASESQDNWGVGTIKLWSVETGRELRTLLGYRPKFSLDGNVLAFYSRDNDGLIKLWLLEEGSEFTTLMVKQVYFSPDGKYLAGIPGGNMVKLWKLEGISPSSSYVSKVVEVDMNIPQTNMENNNAMAVVIGNRDYQKTKQVTFAINDARAIRNYLIKTLGFKNGNIFFIENATQGDFRTYFGIVGNHKGKLYNAVKKSKSDVFIFYSGHGAPGLNNQKGYFVPVECDPQYVELGGYSLDTFYENISKIPAKSTTVVLDACFSGATIYENISPIVIKIENPVMTLSNGVVLSSSSGNQVSCWYNEKKHGLFSYFFLKAIHNKNADFNKDDQLTFAEIYQFISDESEGVPYYARRIHGVEQNPMIQGRDKDRVFVRY